MVDATKVEETNAQPVVVFGGSGFLGRRIVRRLLASGRRVRAASRRPGRWSEKAPGEAAPELVEADIRDVRSTAAALIGAGGVVNAVSLYVERGDTFRSIHVQAAARLARLAREAGVARLVQLSGVGADSASSSAYIRARGEGEVAVRQAFPKATIIRPSVMVGPGDGFLSTLANLLERSPVLPLFGRGETRLAPVHVEDVAEAAARILNVEQPTALYEFGGPDTLTYTEIVRLVARRVGRRPLLLPVPLALWTAAARVAELAPRPPITVNQIDLMRAPNMPSGAGPGLLDLSIDPTPLARALEDALAARQAGA